MRENFSVDALSDKALDAFLREEITARIAYVDRRGQPYIVPISYAYDGDAFYGYSLLGAKIESMGASPRVCVEVDRVSSATTWICVVATGDFEVLRGEHAIDAVRRVSDRLRTVARADALSDAAQQTYVARMGGVGLAYRIRIVRKSGRQATDAPA